MKIALISPDAPPATGGVARVVENIAAHVPGAELIVPPNFSYPTLLKTFWRARLASVTVIHHILPVGTVALLSRIFGGPKYVLFFHGMDFDLATRSAWRRWLSGRIIAGASAVIANSKTLAGEIEVALGKSATVIYPTPSSGFLEAVDVRGKGVELKDVLRLAIGATGLVNLRPKSGYVAPLKILSIARLVSRKGVDRVIRSLVDLPGVELAIVGDGPARGALEKLGRELGVHERVKFYGNQPNHKLHQYYKDADIFALPVRKESGDREGFGIVYLEAGLYGLPIVATDVAGVNEAVLNEETGLLVPDADDAVLPALKRLVEDAALRRRLGERGQAHALALRPETEMSKLTKILESIGAYV